MEFGKRASDGTITLAEARTDDRGAVPRFAMASPSIWCRMTSEPPFSRPLSLSLARSLPPLPLPLPLPRLPIPSLAFIPRVPSLYAVAQFP